ACHREHRRHVPGLPLPRGAHRPRSGRGLRQEPDRRRGARAPRLVVPRPAAQALHHAGLRPPLQEGRAPRLLRAGAGRAVKRSSGLEPLGIVLSRDAGLRVPGSIETSPVSARDWEAAVGSRIAARARPVRLDRGVLLVRTATATWAQELALLADAIL